MNAEIMRVAYILDRHGGEIIAGIAVTDGDIRDLIIGCVVARFDGPRASHRAQRLPGNDPIYIADKTITATTGKLHSPDTQSHCRILRFQGESLMDGPSN
ncbi:MAG: hypothetical protein WCJ64_22595 [Rhodospirillaceae bacterium]